MNLSKLFCIGCLSLFFTFSLAGQDDRVQRTFKDTRAVNIHSVETLPAKKLDIRISHRFGDLFGDSGGWQTFYGLEAATDVAIGGEIGLSDRLTVGLYRSKGSGQTPEGEAGLRQLLNGLAKYRLLYQTADNRTPISAALVLTSSMSTSEKVEGVPNLIRSFPLFSHRFAFNAQLVLARKFGEEFSFELVPGITHRNLVPFDGENTIFSLGAAGHLQITRVFALVADVTLPFSPTLTNLNGYFPPVGLGFEFDTGGHVFQISLTNATGIFETDFIPYTISDWSEGEFRLGFTISRWFNL
ncbi:MAG: DUF5777 family beta-barrel protein [Bacteroidota bacterium]